MKHQKIPPDPPRRFIVGIAFIIIGLILMFLIFGCGTAPTVKQMYVDVPDSTAVYAGPIYLFTGPGNVWTIENAPFVLRAGEWSMIIGPPVLPDSVRFR